MVVGVNLQKYVFLKITWNIQSCTGHVFHPSTLHGVEKSMNPFFCQKLTEISRSGQKLHSPNPHPFGVERGWGLILKNILLLRVE